MTDPADPRETDFHPRLRTRLYGHEVVENQMLSAFKADRLHHAWLLTGAKGIGKATLAYRFARFILRHPDPAAAPQDLAVSAEDEVFKRIASRGHADLLIVERPFDEKSKRLKAEIGVAEARAISRFFNHTAGEGGWRVCILDGADDLNLAAANALLKILEEPPRRALILLIAHQSPGRLLPTICSRCIMQRMLPLDPELVTRVLDEIGDGITDGFDPRTLADLAQGSPGRGIELLNTNAAKHLMAFEDLISAGPPYGRAKMYRLADQLAARGEQPGYAAFCDLLCEWIMRRGHDTASDPARSPGSLGVAADWAELYQAVDTSIEQANILNLDRRSVMLEAFRRIEQVGRSKIAT